VGFLDWFRSKPKDTDIVVAAPGGMRLNMVTMQGNGFFAWDGRLFRSDIIRAATRPKVKAVGKLVGKHIRESLRDDKRKLEINPEPVMRFLLERPNPFMSGQDMQEKMGIQLELNGNAFALIMRSDGGVPVEIYPIPATSVEAVYNRMGALFLRFIFPDGKQYTFPYADIIHLRQDFHENDIFGESIAPALVKLMNVVTTIDQGIISAIKNSAVIRWLLKTHTVTRSEDIKKMAEEFVQNYLTVSSGDIGVAATNAAADVTQVKPYDYAPNAATMDRVRERVYALFGVNEKIVKSNYTEDEWNSFYEAQIAPVAGKLNAEFTHKLFTRREIGHGNKIMFEAFNLTVASANTKMAMQGLVDRGIMTRNEHRAILGFAPVPGGDRCVIRREYTEFDEDGNVVDDKGGDKE